MIGITILDHFTVHTLGAPPAINNSKPQVHAETKGTVTVHNNTSATSVIVPSASQAGYRSIKSLIIDRSYTDVLG